MKDFDRLGKCPICLRPFQSDDCSHSHAYVVSVLNATDTQFQKDIERVRAQHRK